MAATNIITGTVANYTDTTANTLIATTKADKVARADTEVATIATADWANKVCDDLTSINAVMRGAAGPYVWVTHTVGTSTASGSRVYLSNVNTNRTSITYDTQWPCPADGEVVQITWKHDTTSPTAVIVNTHVGSGGADPSTTPVESRAAADATVDTTYHWSPAATTFSKGDVLTISIEAGSSMGNMTATALIKLDTNTL